MRDLQLFLSEVRRVLEPGGRLAVTTPAHRRLIAAPDPLLAASAVPDEADAARAARPDGIRRSRAHAPGGRAVRDRIPLERGQDESPYRHELRRTRAVGHGGLHRAPDRGAPRAWERGGGGGAPAQAARRRGARAGAGGCSGARSTPRSTWPGSRSGLRRRARRARADVVHHPLPAWMWRAPCAQAITVHDLSFERFPEGFGRVWRALARRRHRAAARRAGAVVCVSRTAAADAVGILGADPAVVVVAPHGPGQALPVRRRSRGAAPLPLRRR